MIRRWAVAATLCCLPAVAALADSPRPLPVATIEDAIAMVRIQHRVAADGSVGAFSPDGRRFAAVVWHGDLPRNVNVYSLLAFDLGDDGRWTTPRTVLTRDFPGDPEDQEASPFQQLIFLGDNRTIAFLGREGQAAAQVYTVDAETGAVRQLTHHSSKVRSFIVSSEGALRAFSAIAHEEDDGGASRAARIEGDGVFLWDATLFSPVRRYRRYASLMGDWASYVRQYFLLGDSEAKLFFDTRQSRPNERPDPNDPSPYGLHQDARLASSLFVSDPQARKALLFPFALTGHPMHPERYAHYADASDATRRFAAPHGVVDLATGRVERLLDAPRPRFICGIAGAPLWALDGRSVIVFTLLPIGGGSSDNAEQPPQWVEVELATRRVSPVAVPPGWDVLRWDARGTALVLRNGERFALLPRASDRNWGTLAELGAPSGLSAQWQAATNGWQVIGVKEGPLIPPELVAFDLDSKSTTTLSQLNPQLHRRRYGAVEELTWPHRFDPSARAYLVKPVDYRAGVRYPLVVLLDDGVLTRVERPYLLDGTRQLSGHAVQMLAAQGFVVLYSREPRRDPEWVGTAKEGEVMREHIETAIATLDRAGLIDPSRVGISGWSRAGYHVDSLLIHSSHRFAAATQIDGGASEYNEGLRPFTDEELKRIRTPLLFQPHRLPTMVSHATMADRLESFGKPTEILYFATASHSTTRPQHRLRSLGTHVDWWRFWLKGEEDASPAKVAQYARWRKLREMQKQGS